MTYERMNKQRRRVICIALTLLAIAVFMLQCFYITAYADESEGVLADFAGTDFDIADYPSAAEDPTIEDPYKLDVFQLAETTSGELLVYVYQPSVGRKFVATTIRLSTSIGDNAKFHDLPLEFVDSEQTIYKYKVKDFTVMQDALRYYLIAAIHRPWDLTIDGELGNGESGDEAVCAVGKLFTASTVAGEVSYTVTEQDVLQVASKTMGMLRYVNGISWSALSQFDSHWVAFSFDRPIDEVLSADIGFIEYSYTVKLADKDNPTIDEENPHRKEVHITSDQTGTNADDVAWLGKVRTWDRISRAADFRAAHLNDLSDDQREALLTADWVFQFYETEYYVPQGGGLELLFSAICPWVALGVYLGENCTGTLLREVTLIQLTYETAGIQYTLGVIDDKRTGSWKPSNISDELNIPVWVYFVGIAIVILIVLVLLAIFAPQVLPVIMNGVVMVVSAPFKLMSAFYTSCKNANAARQERNAAEQAEKDRAEARQKQSKDRRKDNVGDRS